MKKTSGTSWLMRMAVNPNFLLILGNHAQDGIPSNHILSRRRFVEKHNLGIRHQGSTQGHPFLHASRELRRILAATLRQFHLLHPGLHLLFDGFLTQRGRLPEGQGNIVKDRHRVKESIVLEHVTDLAEVEVPLPRAHLLEGLTAKQDRAFVGCHQPDDVLEQDALARAALADDGGHVSLIDLQIHPVENGMVVEPLGHLLEFDQWRFHRCLQNERRDDVIGRSG